jgi:nitroimidazol reductase NimA-like FMN-containing flavoprotein (pyridoxamine 5'-phosphate oxidase superfamily)
VQVCVTITHLDGLVLARSAFNHSMNYRCAVVYGKFERVQDKHGALASFMDHIAAGRQAEIRPGSDKEFAATTVMRIALAEAACKVREGGPVDDEVDLQHSAWAGVLPLVTAAMPAVPDPACTTAAPVYVRQWGA